MYKYFYGSVKKLDKEINEYLEVLNIQQKQAVLGVVKTFAREEKAWRDDKSYNAEMNKRFSELESKKELGLTLEQLETAARLSYKKSCVTKHELYFYISSIGAARL